MKTYQIKRVAALAAFAAGVAFTPSVSQAVMTLNPVAPGPAVVVTGFNGVGGGSPGHAELIVNGVSRGSVKVAGDGTFSFPAQNIAAGASLGVRSSQVWNFNTNGDGEGWGSNDGSLNVTVSGGALHATVAPAGGNKIIFNASNIGGSANLVSSDGAPTTYSRVLEFRLRNANTTASAVTAFYHAPPEIKDIPATLRANDPNFRTYMIPLDSDASGPTGYATNGTVFWLGLRMILAGPNAYATGDTVDIDYIRLSEYCQWEFQDGDNMLWRTGAGTISPSATSTVTTDTFDITAGANGEPSPAMSLFEPGANYDKRYFNNLTVGFRAATGTQNIWFFGDGSGGPFTAGNLANKLYTPGAAFQEKNTNLPGNALSGPTWYTDGSLPNTGQMLFVFQPADAGSSTPAGTTTKVDYIRFGPAPTLRFGPSPNINATVPSAAVNDWNLY